MGLLEKLKNTFFEEEYIEVEEEEKVEKVVKKEKPIAKKVELKPKKVEKKVEPAPVIEAQEEAIEETVVEQEPEIPNYSDKEILKKESSIQYFDESDFVDEVKPQTKEERSNKLYGEDPKDLYRHLDIEKENDHQPYSNSNARSGFKPTPVISPIYGILDKNYRKEEVIDKKDKPSSYVSRRNADLDFVRNKAFGRLEDDMMVNSFEENVEETAQDEYDDVEVEVNDNLLADMTETDSLPSVNKVTIADAEEYFEDLGLEYNVDYKDSRYEKATGRRSSKTIKEETNVEEDDDDNLENNLFDLVDSMYEEKE